MKTLFVLFCFLLLPNAVSAEDTRGDKTAINKTCPAQKLCPDLERLYQACRKKPDTKVCINFIETMKQFSPTYDCSRAFDKGYIVPAIWLCGENRREGGASYDEVYYELLSKLKLKEAKEYFASSLFRSILDGHMAEEYYERSERLEKKLKAKKMK